MSSNYSALEYCNKLCELLKQYKIAEYCNNVSEGEKSASFMVKVKGKKKMPIIVVEKVDFENFIEFRVNMPEELRALVYEIMEPKDSILFNKRYVVT